MSPLPAEPLVLIVEDDSDTREMYALFLVYSGLRVAAAPNADEGFAMAVEQQPDIVVTDFMLGGPGTGAELCRRLRQDERTAQIPVLVLTGSSRKADAEAAEQAGCADVRIKPYLPDALLSDIRQILGRPRGQRVAG